MKKRDLLTAVIALLSVMATTAQTLTITTSSGSKQFSASDITSGSPATFTSNGTRMSISGNTYTVSDIISALVACENQGYVKKTCPDCKGDTRCTTCHGTGIGCTTCKGTGKYCSECGGSGICPNKCAGGKCKNCLGSRKQDCSLCYGHGTCPICWGDYKLRPNCSGCHGTNICKYCGGSKTEKCSECTDGNCKVCKGSYRCGKCKGDPKCGTCGGDGHCAKCKNSDGKCVKCTGNGFVWADIVLSDNSITLSHQGDSKYVAVTINQSWKATCSASWITLKDAEGRNSGKITITADTNTSEDSRTATLVISFGGKSEYVSITQKGKPVNLSVKPDDFSIHRNGGEQTLKVTSDTYWTVSTDATWLSFSKYSGNGDGEVVVKASANEGNARSAIITFTHNKTEVKVMVSQDAKLYVPFEISNVIIMNTDGGSSSINIINMERDGLYASKLQYLSERITFNIKTYGAYYMTRKWYFPGSTQADKVETYYLPFSSNYDNPFTVSFYNTYWKPSYYKTGTHRWEYYYEDELIYTKTFNVY